MSGSKFYIYGGGRWREVDIRDGRVDGWGRARFVYPKRGKVHVAKTKTVLAGLQALNAGKPSSVKIGPRLPFKRLNELKTKRDTLDHDMLCENSHCCQHSLKNGCLDKNETNESMTKVNNSTQCIRKADAGIQTSLPLQTLNKESRKRKTVSTSSDDITTAIKQTTNVIVHTASKSPKKLSLKRKHTVNDSSDENERRRIKQRKSIPKANSLVHKKNVNGDAMRKNNHKSMMHVQENLITKLTVERRQQSAEAGSGISRQVKIPKEQIPKSYIAELRSDSSDCQELSLTDLKRRMNEQSARTSSQEQCKELIILESDIQVLRKYLIHNSDDFDLHRFDYDDQYKKMCFLKINPLVNVERCPKIARMLRRDSRDTLSLKDFVSHLGLKSISDVSSQKRYRTRRNKPSNYLMDRNSGSDFDKENSDVNSSPNEQLLHIKNKHKSGKTSTPKRNPSTDSSSSHRVKSSSKMLKENNRETRQKPAMYERDALKHTTVTSIEISTDDSNDNHHRLVNKSRDRYQTSTKQERKANSKTVDKTSNANSDSDNSEEHFKNNSRDRNKNLSLKPNEKTLQRKERETNSNDIRSLKPSNQQPNVHNNFTGLKISEVKSLATKSKALHKPFHREYSNLEDHTIISWISVGNRARSVNGNNIWKELEEEYPRIAGISRTWHSLRNRYLRYILPSLGALPLEPAQVAELRAAAAIGSIKAKRLKNSRRNSIFAAPDRGALSRRPGAAHDNDVNDNTELNVKSPSPPKRTVRSPPPPRHSPRYSDITRRFAATHRSNDSTPNVSLAPAENKKSDNSHKPPKNSRKSGPSSTKSMERSKNSVASSDKSSEIPKNKVPSSNESSDMSKKTIPNSNKSSDMSKKTVPNSNKSSDISKKKVPSSNKSSEFSKKKVPSSNKSDSNSSTSSVSSNNSIPNSNKSVDSQRKPNRIKSRKIEDASSESSQSPVRRSLRSNSPVKNQGSKQSVARTRRLYNPATALQ